MDVTVDDLRANLADILRKVADGEPILVTKDGRPYVRLIREKADETPHELRPGAFRRTPFHMADDFDELGPEWDEPLS